MSNLITKIQFSFIENTVMLLNLGNAGFTMQNFRDYPIKMMDTAEYTYAGVYARAIREYSNE